MRLASLALLAMLTAAPALAQEAAEPTLAELLSARGWVAVQLRENAYSQLETEIEIEGGHKLRAQVSTSFSKTIFDEARMRKFAFEIEKTSIEITGRDGKQRLGSVPLDSIRFAETSVGPFTIFTAKLDDLVSRPEGSEPYHAVIGSDFLTRYHAILDIPSSRLYLRAN